MNTEEFDYAYRRKNPSLPAQAFGLGNGILFVVYFWNLDQKVLGWSYVQVNRIFDRKKQDIKF